MQGLNYVVGTTRYRHGYQGQFAEKDEETGTDDFELRNYDSRIGRWTAPDPAGQFHSPYVGMGNNPVSSVDPDGGFISPLAAMGIGAAVGGIAGGIYSKSHGEVFGMVQLWVLPLVVLLVDLLGRDCKILTFLTFLLIGM
ncbi:hypothetical protein GKZ67_22170 (plasmid) [Hymenobacter sp. BRD67]|nr:hypothetical protein GKZ67_22170 [Hymenobacter sp. BRD67]